MVASVYGYEFMHIYYCVQIPPIFQCFCIYEREGSKSHLSCRIPTIKFVCPKMKRKRNYATKRSNRVCRCDNPCTTSLCGRIICIYQEQNLRTYPRTVRGTKEWNSTYKIRVNVKKSINHFKDSFCVTD